MYKKFLSISSLVIISLASQGCSSVRTVTHPSSSSSVTEKVVQNYAIGESQEANIGDSIIEKGRILYKEGSLDEFKAVKNVGDCYRKGNLYDVIYKDRKDDSYYVRYCAQREMGVRVDKDGVLLNPYAYYRNTGLWVDHLMIKVDARAGEKLFEPYKDKWSAREGSYKMEIVYSGMSGDNIKATYREYKDDLARPAFFQDLVYNLNKSRVIRYKNFKVKILDATNQHIEYVVMED